MPPDSLDPVTFCSAQTQMLRASIEALSHEIRRLASTIEALHESRVDDAEAGAARAIAQLTADSDHGRPYWTAGADHIGRRWYDTWNTWLGSWLTKLLGGALLTAAIVWYVTSNGGKR